jgi:4-amino-4-deoxy-L-arabinose transferase-like glycosyltransferase
MNLISNLVVTINSRNQIFFLLIIITFLLAFIARYCFVSTSIEQLSKIEIEQVAKDTKGYFILADHYIENGYSAPLRVDDDPTLDLRRPPGYPSFLSIFKLLKLDNQHTLYTQVFIGSLIPVIIYIFIYLISKNNLISFASAFLSVISPTGIALSGLLMSDLIFSFFFALSFLMLYISSQNNKVIYYFNSAILIGIACLIKPILIYWPVISILVVIAFLKYQKHQYKKIHLIILFLMQILIFSVWCTRNYINYNLFSLSIIGEITLRRYFAVMVEEESKLNKLQKNTNSEKYNDSNFNKRLKENFYKQRALIYPTYNKNYLSDQNKNYRLYKDKLVQDSIRIIRSNPSTALKVFFRNIKNNTISGWHKFHKQIPEKISIFHNYKKSQIIESYIRMFISYSVGLLWIVYCSIFLWKKNDQIKRNFYLITGFILTILFFSFSSGITFFVGSRILYPIEFLYVITFVISLKFLFDILFNKVKI